MPLIRAGGLRANDCSQSTSYNRSTTFDSVWLLGHGGHDLLDGGTGNDTLVGDVGNDRYVIHRGSGQDILIKDGKDDGEVLFVDDGMDAFDQLWFERTESDLVVSVSGTGGCMWVDGFFDNGRKGLDQIMLRDGTVADPKRLGLLLEEMACFAPPTGTDLTLAPSVRVELDQVLSKAWVGPAAA